MSFFGRIAAMFLNEQAVKALSHNSLFQRMAVNTYYQVQHLKTFADKLTTEKFSKIEPQKLSSDVGYALGQGVSKARKGLTQSMGTVKNTLETLDKKLIELQKKL